MKIPNNKIKNVPILFNTSFNLAGDPLVETVKQALETLTKCKASDNAKLEAPSKHFVVNNTTIFRSNIIYFLLTYVFYFF